MLYYVYMGVKKLLVALDVGRPAYIFEEKVRALGSFTPPTPRRAHRELLNGHLRHSGGNKSDPGP